MTTIENIRLLRGAAVLAERNAVTPSLGLKRFNLFYGFNGSGKSTLSRIFAALQHGKKHERLPEGCTFEIEMSDGAKFTYPKAHTGLERRVCVFNNDFIADNLRWESGVASPIFYIGADQAEAAEQLKALEAVLPAARAEHEGEAKLLKEREKAFNEYKRVIARTVSQHLRQAARYEATQFVGDIDKLSASGPKLGDADLDAAIATCARSEAPAKVKPVDVPFSTLLKAMEAAAQLAPRSIGSIVVKGLDLHPQMLPWVNQGHEYHLSHDLKSCLYCGGSIADERKELLAAAFDDELSEFITELNTAAHHARECVEALNIARAAIPAAAQLSAEFQPPFETAASALTVALDDIAPLLMTSLNALRERKSAPTSPVAVELPASEDIAARVKLLERCCEAVNVVCKQHADMVDDFNEHQRKAREAIRRHFVLSSADEYEKHLSEISDATTKEEDAKAAVEKLEGDVVALRAKVQQHGPAADKINALIRSYLGHGELTIVAVAEGYELHRRGALVTGAPSEGEKTAIAICYFLSTLEAEDRKIKDLIIVIDDPVSSLDTKAMNYACGLIRNRLSNASQLIVLTHNQHCMNEFKKVWKGWAKAEPAKATLKFIDVSIPASTMSRTSSIVDLPKHLREYESEYHYLFEKVTAFEEVGSGHFDYTFMMPNVLRRVLEVFLAFKVPHNGNLSDKLKTLCGRHHDLDQDRLHALERLSQVESHSDNLDDLIGQSSLTVEESRDANAALIHLMGTVDAAHLTDLRKYCKP
ncbi:AAA family ATPase [Bradyrhizobium sp. 4]|uniref:AAA family ATPase n=1 Tax=unclassified Bradyrhizobium TaxID=2631580 RepID=UPI001FF99963|nr:AAA family ATPase [Bradyrhizobium sp. 4]MCK1397099.1 AAA family ATPase [Bradyrhizobium sp. 39]MCK1752863.1 AAA family ATPase [Bradyrhizobium sp. 135]UPJ37060.1 AAA family ATPase [Bradyrhizobium sp. 4]